MQMKKMIIKPWHCLWLFVICCSLTISVNAGQRVIELTESSLPPQGQWTSAQLAVSGFRLGMTRPEVLSTAQHQELRVKDDRDLRKVTCEDDWCALFSRQGLYKGVNLHFDQQGNLDRIRISVNTAGDADVLKGVVARSLRGGLGELFQHYSPALRLRLFGREDEQKVRTEPHYTYRDYAYRHLGIAIHEEWWDKDDQPVDLDLDLVWPK
jgi:hypothetical protein